MRAACWYGKEDVRVLEVPEAYRELRDMKDEVVKVIIDPGADAPRGPCDQGYR